MDDILDYVKPYINDQTGNEAFQKWFDLLLPIDTALIERNLTGLTELFNESLPIVRELASHVKNQQIGVLLLHTSNECGNLVNKLHVNRANFTDIYHFLARTSFNFNVLLEFWNNNFRILIQCIQTSVENVSIYFSIKIWILFHANKRAFFSILISFWNGIKLNYYKIIKRNKIFMLILWTNGFDKNC